MQVIMKKNLFGINNNKLTNLVTVPSPGTKKEIKEKTPNRFTLFTTSSPAQ